MHESNLKQFLDEKALFYNQQWFIEKDPVSIPHRFARKEDIEISAFLTATIAWGQRPMILKKAALLMQMLDNEPHDFITAASTHEFSRFATFVYRTFNGFDCCYFVSALREIYLRHGGLEMVFTDAYQAGSVKESLHTFRNLFLSYHPLKRTEKHIANVVKNASAKRLNMFLRWMVRRGDAVDFGLWTGIEQSDLMIPLDVHAGRTARKLGLLVRKQDDWKAVAELTANLKEFRPADPVFYDYALFGLGVYEKF
ncbi:MAG: TIGR02757 family protein [Cytophagaceae bacterium]|jgi:uncharacterized protein (TIGR02757 family)|nr:TIGR02757 family protein [Cytophagaceae bacterium]